MTRKRRHSIEIDGYYRLRSGQEVQVTGHQIIQGNDCYRVRYPDQIMSGNSYQVDTHELRIASVATKYGK